METLIVAVEHRNERSFGNDRSSRTFRQINCRTFHHSGVGLLPRPKRTSSTPPRSPKSVLPVFNHQSSPIPIARGNQIRRCASEFVDKRRSFELWAGPTYSNSPPAASVPIPKFSLKGKRTVSLSFEDLCEGAKSAPVSPTSSGDNSPFGCTVSATMTLRRMLNLEFADE